MEEDLYDTPWEFKNKTFVENIAAIEAATANNSNLLYKDKKWSNKGFSENSSSLISSNNSSPLLSTEEKKDNKKITKENSNNDNNLQEKIKTIRNMEKNSSKQQSTKYSNNKKKDKVCSKHILATVAPVNIKDTTKNTFNNNCDFSFKDLNKDDEFKRHNVTKRHDYKQAINNGTCFQSDDSRSKYVNQNITRRTNETNCDNNTVSLLISNPSSPFDLVSQSPSTSPLSNQSPKSLSKHSETSSPLARHTTILTTTKTISPRHNKQQTSYQRSSHNDTINIPNLENTFNNQSSLNNIALQKCTSSKSQQHLSRRSKLETEDMIIHDNVDRTVAERMLQKLDSGHFLLRRRPEGNMAMSLKGNSGILHIKLEQRSGRWILGEGPTFSSISSVVRYYRNHELPIRGAEHIILKSPILVQREDKFFC